MKKGVLSINRIFEKGLIKIANFLPFYFIRYKYPEEPLTVSKKIISFKLKINRYRKVFEDDKMTTLCKLGFLIYYIYVGFYY